MKIKETPKAQPINFHQWSRCGYSLFKALKQEVRIACLAVAYLYVATPATALANEPADSLAINKEYSLDKVEVSASRAPATYSQQARIVSVTSRKEINAAPAASLQDLLEYSTGVDIRQRGTYGVQADVSIRGGTFDQTLVLLNNINFSDPQTGHHNLNLPFSFDAIQRVEVLNGSSSRIHGPNAFSGAINIITEPTSQKSYSIFKLAGGDYGLYEANASVLLKEQKSSHFFNLNTNASDGYRENTDFKTRSAYYHGIINSDFGKLSIQAGLNNKGFGANGFYTPEYPNQYEETQTNFASAQLEATSGKLNTRTSTYWRRNYDRFELFRSNPASWYTNHNYHMTDVYGLNFNSWLASKFGKSSAGVDFRSENILSNQLGESLEDPIRVRSADDVFYTNGHSRIITSYYLEHSFYLKKVSVSTGIMGNLNSDTPNSINFFPGIDLSYSISNNLKSFLSINRSLRMPTFTDLYYKGPTNIGNKNLKAEQATSYELGLKFNNGIIRTESSFYYQQGKDIIDWVKISEEFLWQPKNLTQINSMGFELSSSLNIGALVNNHRFWIKNISLNYSYNEITKSTSNYISNYTLDNLKHKLVIGITHNISKNLDVNWQFRYEDRNGGYSEFKDAIYVGETSYKPFALADVKANYKLNRFDIFLQCSNIFDKTYYDLGNIPQAGRWSSIGIKYNISW